MEAYSFHCQCSAEGPLMIWRARFCAILTGFLQDCRESMVASSTRSLRDFQIYRAACYAQQGSACCGSKNNTAHLSSCMSSGAHL